MTAAADDYRFLARAIQLAQRGLFTTSPNPMVGAVIVAGGVIVGEGWHQYAGEPHAEVYALRQAGARAKEATLYVSLEPCNHFGRTPPCAQAVIDAGIKRVVIAAADANPNAAGGAQRLIDAGVQVAFIDAWFSINPGFERRASVGMPYVTMKLAASVDARTAMASGESQWITGPEARYQVQRLRAASCAVVTGIDSVIYDNSRLTVRTDDWLEPYGAERVRQPLRVVCDSQLRLPSDAAIVGHNVLVLHASKSGANIDRLEGLGLKLHYCSTDGHRVDLRAGLTLLATEYQCNTVMVEAGATLSAAFVRDNLVDELHVFTAEVLMGASARPLLALDMLQMHEKIPLKLVKTRHIGQDLWQIYQMSGVHA